MTTSIFRLSLFVLALPVTTALSCTPSNCPTNNTCLGHCFHGSRGRQFCFGKCVPEEKPSLECQDRYDKCHRVKALCQNPRIERVCKKSCGVCSRTPDNCSGFKCDGECVPFTYLCDGIQDCGGGFDEENCRYLTNSWFTSKKSRRCGIRANYNDVASPSNRTAKFRYMKVRHRKPRLISATNSKPNSWPWIGLLFSKHTKNVTRVTLCGATLIHKDWAITAAHCVLRKDFSKDRYIIHFGKTYLKKSSKSESSRIQSRDVVQAEYYGEYHSHGIYNDIALLKLNQSVELNEFVNIACMPFQYDLVTYYMNGGVTLGWGSTEKGRVSQTLKQTLTKPMSQENCTREIFHYPTRPISPALLCSEIHGKKFGVICDGDSGGPMLIRRTTGAYALVGVGSFGTDDDCAKLGEASVYTSIYYYLPWIRQVVPDLTFV